MHAIWCETGLRVKLIIVIRPILQNVERRDFGKNADEFQKKARLPSFGAWQKIDRVLQEHIHPSKWEGVAAQRSEAHPRRHDSFLLLQQTSLKPCGGSLDKSILQSSNRKMKRLSLRANNGVGFRASASRSRLLDCRCEKNRHRRRRRRRPSFLPS